MYTGNYEDNKKKGTHFWYHYNGVLERFSYFKNDKKTGKEIAIISKDSVTSNAPKYTAKYSEPAIPI